MTPQEQEQSLAQVEGICDRYGLANVIATLALHVCNTGKAEEGKAKSDKLVVVTYFELASILTNLAEGCELLRSLKVKGM